MTLKEAVETLHQLNAQIADLAKQENAQTDMQDRDQFRKIDSEKRLVYAEVYLPEVEDAHGHSMTAEEIEKMAHGFLKSRRTTAIDINHDNNVDYGCVMVESFIAQKGDPTYMPGAWVGVVKVENDEIWRKVKEGELTGFSFEGLGYLIEE